MHAVTPRLYFQTLCQHEVFRVISTVNTINVFFYFSEKRHKIVEFFALLTTELASYKCYFALFRLQFNVNYNTELFVNRF